MFTPIISGVALAFSSSFLYLYVEQLMWVSYRILNLEMCILDYHTGLRFAKDTFMVGGVKVNKRFFLLETLVGATFS